MYTHTNKDIHTYWRKWGKFPGLSRGGTRGCHTFTCHICHTYCMSLQLHAERDKVPRGTHCMYHCIQFFFSTIDTIHTIYGGSGESFRACPEAEPTDAIHSHVIYVICITCSASRKPSGTSSLEAFNPSCCMQYITYSRHTIYTAEVVEVSGLVPTRKPWMP
jgi:hypothetical protein